MVTIPSRDLPASDQTMLPTVTLTESDISLLRYRCQALLILFYHRRIQNVKTDKLPIVNVDGCIGSKNKPPCGLVDRAVPVAGIGLPADTVCGDYFGQRFTC